MNSGIRMVVASCLPGRPFDCPDLDAQGPYFASWKITPSV